MAKNPKDKWLLILCRAKGGIENIPKIFLANLDSSSLFINKDTSNEELSSKHESAKFISDNNSFNTINKIDTSNKSIRSQLSNTKSIDFSVNDFSFKNTNLNINPNQRLVNALLEIRFELKKDIKNLNYKMDKIDEKLVNLIQNFPSHSDSKELYSPISEKTTIEYIDSFPVTSPNKMPTLIKTPSNPNEESSVNSKTSFLTTFNEVTKVPKSTTTLLEANKLSTAKFNKSKSFSADANSRGGP